MVEIISVVLVILGVLLGSFTSRNRRAEKDVLTDFGFTSSHKWEGNKEVASPNASQFYSSRNLFRSESYPELTIFSALFYEGEGTLPKDNTRIFAFKNINGRYPRFILTSETTNIGTKIQYEDCPDFSNIFDLCSFDNSDNVKLVRDLFDNALLHDDIFKGMKQICSDYITIESDGNHIFYYWKYHLFYAQNFPKIISELTTFHKTYFDSTLD
jgi:hypothetical protein